MKKMKISKKKTAATAFAVFFLVMAVCTAVSRAAASMVVPTVTTGRVQEGKLNILIRGNGTVETRSEHLLALQRGLRVEKVQPTGSAVKQGDVILQYDKAYLQESIEKKQAEITKLELAVGQAQLTGEPPARVEASEGAARDVQLAEENYSKAWESYSSAERAWNEGTAQQQQILDAEIQAAETEKEAAMQQAQQMESEGKPEEAEKLRQQAEAAAVERKTQAQAVYDGAVQELEAQKTQAETELQNQESARTQSYNAYQSAQEQDAAAAENDQKTAEAGSYSVQSAQVDLDEVSVTVPGKGKALKKNVEEVRFGADASFGTAGEKSAQGGGSASGGQNMAGVFYVPLEENEAMYGSEVSYEISRQTESAYQQILPLSAVRKDSDGTFCLVAEQEEKILGNEYKAKRVPVTVLEKDGSSAAVNAALDPDDKVIIGSSKEIAPGDKVRLEE